MTYSPTGQTQLARHYADIGYHEGPNNRNDFSKWQYGDYYNPWCASFVSFCAVEGGNFEFPDYFTYGAKGDSNVYWLGQHFMRMGIWREAHETARAGWIVCLSFGVPWQHTEEVLADQGPLGALATIGGNTGDAVKYRTRYRANVIGFGALDEAGQNAPPPAPPKEDDVKPTEVMDTAINDSGGRYVLLASGEIKVSKGTVHHGDYTKERPVPPPLDMGRNHAVSLTLKKEGGGYWIMFADGSVHPYGAAGFHGNFHKDAQPPFTAGGLFLSKDAQVGYRAVRSDTALMTPR